MTAPLFTHDCPDCVFLMHWVGNDLYFHPKEPRTVIARYGSEGSDYLSGPADVSRFAIGIAVGIAIERGLLS